MTRWCLAYQSRAARLAGVLAAHVAHSRVTSEPAALIPIAREFGRLDFAKIQQKRQLALETEKGKFVAAIAAHLGRELSSIETAAARGTYDQLAPVDLEVIPLLPRNPVPDAFAFGKFLEQLRALEVEWRGRKG